MPAPEAALSLTGLGLLFSALSRHAVTLGLITDSQAEDTQARVILTPTHCLLPAHLSHPSCPHPVQLSAIAHAAAHLLFSPHGLETTGLKPMGIAVVSAIEDARIEAQMRERFPGTSRWFRESLAQSTDEFGLNCSSLIHRMSRALGDDTYQDEHFWIQKAKRLFHDTRITAGLADYQSFRKLASVLANDLGQMRVQFNAQQYVVPERYRDDHSYLWRYADTVAALTLSQEITLQNTKRATASVDQRPTKKAQVTEVIHRYHYPEWDYQRHVLKTDWCRLLETKQVSDSVTRESIFLRPSPLHLKLNRSKMRRPDRAVRGQPEGDQIDLNAAVQFMVSRQTMRCDEPRYFVRPQLRKRTGSVLLIMDLSESANDIILSTPKPTTILDLERQAALALAASASMHGDRVAIHGFSSDTRSKAHYHRFLDFGETLTPEAEKHVMTQQAQYSTRLGTAIRHGVTLLRPEATDYLAMLVLSDGMPADIDVFDADYLIEDAHHAVQFAKRHGVYCYGLIFETQAEQISRRIFGLQNYRIIARAESLPRHLEQCYQSLSQRLS